VCTLRSARRVPSHVGSLRDCGKSTLLSIIGLLDTPTGGRYQLNSQPVENLGFAERSRIRNQEIGFIFQSFNLIGDLTVYEMSSLPLTYRQKMPAVERKKRVMEALGAPRRYWRTACATIPSQTLRRQQQRVAVARALGESPPFCWPMSPREIWIRARRSRHGVTPELTS